MNTINDVAQRLEKQVPGILKGLALLPDGYRCVVKLRGESRDKRRTASFEKSWCPDTDSIIIEFERDSTETIQRFPGVKAESPQPQQPGHDLSSKVATGSP